MIIFLILQFAVSTVYCDQFFCNPVSGKCSSCSESPQTCTSPRIQVYDTSNCDFQCEAENVYWICSDTEDQDCTQCIRDSSDPEACPDDRESFDTRAKCLQEGCGDRERPDDEPLPTEFISSLLKRCESERCHGQSDEAKLEHSLAVTIQERSLRAIASGLSSKEISDGAQTKCEKVLSCKVNEMMRQGFKDKIEPTDNCIIEGDLYHIPALNQESVDDCIVAVFALLKETGGTLPQQPLVRKRRNALIFNPKNRFIFTSPIPYVVDFGNRTEDAKLVAVALRKITDKIPEITFEPRRSDESRPYMKFVMIKVNGQGGQASLGTLGTVNEAYIFSGTMTENIVSVVLHEAQHLLGIGHTHAREDRDKFLKFNLENLKFAQDAADIFRRSKSSISALCSTSARRDTAQEFCLNFKQGSVDLGVSLLGVYFDYLSSMLYQSNVYAKPGTTLMEPQRFRTTQITAKDFGRKEELSCGDMSSLMRTFVCPKSDCKDELVDCGYFAVTNTCNRRKWMKTANKCKLSCAKCCQFECPTGCPDANLGSFYCNGQRRLLTPVI